MAASALLVLAACGDRSPSTEAGAPGEAERSEADQAGNDGGAPVTTAAERVPAGGWERLDDVPLPGRATAVTFWVDGELVVVGGDTFTCPDNADCGPAPDVRSFTDGAALDPATGTWRPIPDAPVPFSHASVAVVGADAFLLTTGDVADPTVAGPAVLRYSAADDAWTELPLPAGDPGWMHLVAAGERVVALSSSDEAGAQVDQVLDPATGTWSPLPDDPLPSSFDRQAVWSAPHLYLLAKAEAKISGSEPAVLQVARLDLATGTWEHLPDSDRIGYGPWLAEDGELTAAHLGSADGGEVNPWDRVYQLGGTYDVATGAWRDLPAPPAGVEGTAGAFGAEGAAWQRAEGLALDVTRDGWVEVPAGPTEEGDRPVVATAGRDLVAVTGYRWADPDRQDEAELLTATWIWRPPT